MKVQSHNKIWLLPILALAAISVLALRSRDLSSAPKQTTSLSSLPAVMLWAWERPEKLDFIDPSKVGVAFLAKSIFLDGDKVSSRRRLQPLDIPHGTRVVAVVRLESNRKDPATLSVSQLTAASLEIRKVADLPNLTAVQLDFDATLSERDFYRQLLTEVRKQLPTSISLSMTALASWCEGDYWLAGLPVDEAVPMLFRMGVESKQFHNRLEAGEPFSCWPCLNSAGVSTDEIVSSPHVERLYIFNPNPWTAASLSRALENYKR
jgi:hypothetical protein